jgi:hypothetical protein
MKTAIGPQLSAVSETPKRPRPDFALVRLSAVGLERAGDGGRVYWANGRRHFEFRAGEAQEVERSYEWNHLLRHELHQGVPMFEEVDDEAAALPEPLRGLVEEGVSDAE